MNRTTVYLEEQTALAIRHLAKSQNRSQAEIIREALRQFVKEAGPEVHRPPIVGIGAYRSGHSDVSKRVEEILRETAKKKKQE